jgi:hypothetical protein
VPSELCARLVDTSIAIGVAAVVGAGRQPDKRCHVSPRFKRAMVDLGNKNRCGRLAHGTERRKTLNFVCMRKAPTLVSECLFSVGNDLFDLPRDKVVMAQHAFDIAPKEWRQRPTVTGPQCVKALPQALADAFAGEPNSMQRQKPLDTPDNTDAFFDKVLSLALDAPWRLLARRSE